MDYAHLKILEIDPLIVVCRFAYLRSLAPHEPTQAA